MVALGRYGFPSGFRDTDGVFFYAALFALSVSPRLTRTSAKGMEWDDRMLLQAKTALVGFT